MDDSKRDDVGNGDEAGADLLLAGIQPRWGAERTERNLLALLERLGLRRRPRVPRGVLLAHHRRRISRVAR